MYNKKLKKTRHINIYIQLLCFKFIFSSPHVKTPLLTYNNKITNNKVSKNKSIYKL